MREKLKVGEKAENFRLPSVDGREVELSGVIARTPATVVMFICNHCPYVKAYVPRMVALQEEFSGKGGGAKPQASLIGICSNDAATYPDDSFENMKRVAKEWGLNFPYLRDEDQRVADAYGAERTPEIFVLDRQGVCRYEGGIDDCYQDENRVTRRPLREAILDLAAGRPVREPQTYAIGCSIKWKKG